MLVLAVETSGPTGSLALGRFIDGRLDTFWQNQWQKKAIHSEIATVQLSELLDKAKIKLEAIDRYLVNTGPGSFTGLRVGVNLTRTLAYSFDRPIASLGTLALLANKYGRDEESVFVAIRAIQNFYYAAGFKLTAKGLSEMLAPSSVADTELVTMANAYTKILIERKTADFSPDLNAVDLLYFLDQRPDATIFRTWNEINPVYIRRSEAEEKLLKGLLKK